MKINKKTIIILTIAILVAGYFGFNSLFKKESDSYKTEKVSRGEVLQEVSETGSVKATENINLSFKTTGRIEAIKVEVGDNVKTGQVLARQDTSQLYIQLQEANAAVSVAEAQYQKLIAGATPEDIKVTENARDSAAQDLNDAYKSALNTLNDVYIKTYNAYTTANSIQSSYFGISDQQGIKVANNKNVINESLANVKTYLDKAKIGTDQDVDKAISETIKELNNVSGALKIIRDITDDGIYYSKVSSTDKTSLDTQKSNINTALTNVIDSQQDIISYKIALQKAESQLTLKKAPARQEDVNLYKAQVLQAEAKANLLQQQIQDNSLKSPIDAKITKVNRKAGEVVSISDSVISLLSINPFQIKVNIYEQDIVKVKIADSVKITLVAFPKNTFSGKVISIDPAEKIIDNVVYYEVTVDFDGNQEGIRSGMTADIVIETNKKENVLRVPQIAVEKIDNKEIVQVIKNGKVEDRQIEIGLEGADFYEIVSGLSEGEEVVIGKK